MKKNLPLRLECICYLTCANWFATFLDPKNRGPKFTWDNFPNLVANQCAIQAVLVTDFNLSEATKNRYDKQIRALGKKYTQSLLEAAKLV